MRALFFMVCLVACKTTHSLDVASHADAASAAQIETHEVKEYGPEHITMTVEEYSQLCDPKETPPPEGGGADRVSGSPASGSVRPSASASTSTPTIAQVLIRRTVTVTDRGPSLDDLRTISSLQSKLNSATKIETKDESKPGGIFSLWWLVGLLPLVAGVLIWKLQPAWAGAALAALKAFWNVAKSLFGRKAS